MSNIQWLVSSNSPGDNLMFYYSGHGSFINDNNNDESDNKDEVIMPVDYKTSGIIADDWLFINMVKKVTSGVNLWIFTDCCNSGTNSDLYYNCEYLCKSTPNNPNNPNCENTYIFTNQKIKEDITGNVCMFSGCLDDQLSIDAYISNKYQGVFTVCFIEFIKAHCKDEQNNLFQENTVRLLDALKEINTRIHNLNFTQNSMLSVGNISDMQKYLNI